MNLTFSIAENIKQILPQCRLGIITCDVKVYDSPDTLLSKTSEVERVYTDQLSKVSEGKLDVIAETRKAYKVCGKEPSRYRPSAEALLRRVRQGKGLYKINNVVDTINLLSMTSQFSIGGFDEAHISGDVTLDIGDANEYQAIGRGSLNIEYMPGVKDVLGFFGTPTSDSERTMVTSDISRLVLVYYDFMGNSSLEDSLDSAKEALSLYCDGKNIEVRIID